MDQMNSAGLGKRILGGIIDIIFLIIVFVIYARIFGTKIGEGYYHMQGISVLILFLLMFLYFFVLEAATGKTLGKLVVKTKVVNANGRKISWGQSFVRNFMRVIDGMFVYLVAVIAIAASQHNQRLGDMLARTYVVND